MPFPHFDGKHLHDALFSPGDVLKNWSRRGPLPPAPAGVVFCWARPFFEWAVETECVEPLPWPTKSHGEMHWLGGPGRLAICGNYGQGGPEIAEIAEILIALGTKRFVNIGVAGGLGAGTAIGDVVLCDRAIRDEGTSHHYLEPGQYVYPDTDLTSRLEEALRSAGREFRRGATWTIDAIFRETVAEARHYASLGTLTVEMEAASLFAVAKVRGVRASSAFVISDLLLDDAWIPPDPAEIEQPLKALFSAARQALA